MASDALISDWADSFLSRLTSENRALWDSLLDQFLQNPVTDQTVTYPETGEPEALSTVVYPFVVIFRFVNAETVAIANITWAPGSPGAELGLASRL